MSSEKISAFAYNTGKEIEMLIEQETNNLKETNDLLQGKIMQWYNITKDVGFADHFGITVLKSDESYIKEGTPEQIFDQVIAEREAYKKHLNKLFGLDKLNVKDKNIFTWLPYPENKPTEDGEYNVTLWDTEEDESGVEQFTASLQWNNKNRVWHTDLVVTAFMPLPEPYKP